MQCRFSSESLKKVASPPSQRNVGSIRGVFNEGIVIFQRYDFDFQNGKVVVIEKMGEEEGFGAWVLKKLIIALPRSSYRSEYEDEIDWDDPVIVLR
jgi:hypothetical protein